MAATTDFISEINSKLMYWKLKVCIVRLWENTDRDRPDCPFSIEVILMDEKGDCIHASLGRSLFPNFRESIKEMGLYFIKNFVIKPYLNESNDKPIVLVMQLIRSHRFRGSVAIHEIEKLIDCRHQENYYIVAKIIHLEIDRGWSFLACKQCAKGVDEVGDKLYSRQCGFVESVIRRYKLKVRVLDDTGTISVMLWDGVATKMIGKYAADLFESSDGQGQDEVFKVVTFTDDEDIIEKYKPPPRGETFKDPDFNDNQVSLDDREFMDSTEDTELINVSQTPNKMKKIDAATVDEEDPNLQLSGNKIKRVFKKKKTI
ncbi:hypothetical protein KY285_001319 [Solanum tuberosum]|nr:hypothetical protein KY285_001319 [Solanum tuberosum]